MVGAGVVDVAEEVLLLDLAGEDELLDRAEARADLEGAGGALGHLDVHDDSVGRGALLLAHLDALEVAELVDQGAPIFELRLVVEVTLADPELPPDHRIASLRVAADVDSLDVPGEGPSEQAISERTSRDAGSARIRCCMR